MTTKSKIIEFLEQNKNKYISGESLAKSLNISRNAVCKTISQLRKNGYIIESSVKKGYKLNTDSDVISPEGISVLTSPKINKENIMIFDILDSTNDTAKQLAAKGSKNKTVVIANQQTSGKGRLGRSFYSPKDSGIYMSIIYTPKISANDSILITTCTSVAVSRAIEKICGVKTYIKWVNDIICHNKKVCGILTEAVTSFENLALQYVIIGIGINCFEHEMPDDLLHKAGAISKDRNFSRNALCAEILNQFFRLADNIENREFIHEYKEKSIVVGKNIEILSNGKTYNAKAIDIDESGGLVVKTENGEIQTLNSGEVSLLGDFYK